MLMDIHWIMYNYNQLIYVYVHKREQFKKGEPLLLFPN